MRRSLLLFIWIITDAVLFVGAYACAYFLRVGLILSTDFPLDRYLQTALLITPFWIAVMIVLGIFRIYRIQSEWKNLAYILFACVMGLSFFTLAYYFVFNAFFSRLILVYAGVLSFAAVTVWHLAFDQWQRRILRRNPPAFPLLIIGTNREAERFIITLNEKLSPFKPVAILDAAGTSKKDIAGVPVLGKLNKLEDVIKEYRPSHLVQCSNLEHTINLMSVCRQHGMKYVLLPSVLGAVTGTSEKMEGRPVIMA
jgi:FlaA1/EpsC-like NDP-sugar epimerase